MRQFAVLLVGEAMVQESIRERIEMRIDRDIKQLAERACVALGYASLTEYVTSLIRDNAPRVLEQGTSLQLTNEQFDHFIAACNNSEKKPSRRILAAAKRLDTEGY